MKALIVVVLFLVACAAEPVQEPLLPVNEHPGIPLDEMPLQIEEQDRECSRDSDCTFIEVTCSGCNPPDAAHKDYLVKYNELLTDFCQEYTGVMCDRDFGGVASCVDGECRYVP
ncbi:hypothetical protein GOV09_02860 [Candidatus Woesearchaeota archaeon]|nr:hypothetical protein [Candidatus Woesearchaeota archaeon]